MEEYDRNPPKDKETNPERNQPIKLYILTYNVRSLSSYERLIELTETLKEVKYDIVGIAETRRSRSKIEEYDDFVLCHTGSTPGMYGVGFLIKKIYKNYIESFVGLTERVALLNLNFDGTRLSIIQVYPQSKQAKKKSTLSTPH